jgi:hypothetical protein
VYTTTGTNPGQIGKDRRMTPEQALESLRDNPRYFLKYYPLSTAGATDHHVPNARNPLDFIWYKRAGADARGKQSHVGASRPVHGLTKLFPKVSLDISSFRIGRIQFEHGTINHHFQALSVPMDYYDTISTPPLNINAMQAYLLDNAGADDVMITGQLSGCCFCIRPYAGGLACAHVHPRGYPGGAAAAAALQTDLTANGHFAHYPGALTTFGRQNYPEHATVIGVRSAGTWQIFAQFSNNSHRTLNHPSAQIYPGPPAPL